MKRILLTILVVFCLCSCAHDTTYIVYKGNQAKQIANLQEAAETAFTQKEYDTLLILSNQMKNESSDLAIAYYYESLGYWGEGEKEKAENSINTAIDMLNSGDSWETSDPFGQDTPESLQKFKAALGLKFLRAKLFIKTKNPNS